MKAIIYPIIVQILFFIFTLFLNKTMFIKSYPNFKIKANNGFFYVYWLIISTILSFIVYVFLVIHSKNRDMILGGELDIQLYFVNMALIIFLMFVIYSIYKLLHKQFLNVGLLQVYYSLFLLLAPVLLFTTYFYAYKKHNIISTIIFGILLMYLEFAGLINFKEKYKIYPCSYINIYLNDGTKIRQIECQNIRMNSKWLIIQKKCNRTYLELSTVIRIDCFGNELRIDEKPIFADNKIISVFSNSKNNFT